MEDLASKIPLWKWRIYHYFAKDLLELIQDLRNRIVDARWAFLDEEKRLSNEINILKKENAALRVKKTNPEDQCILSARDMAVRQRIDDLEWEVYKLRAKLRAAKNH